MLTVGFVNFEGLAAPEFWPFGGEQKLPMRELPGGAIYYQPRGDFPTLDHSWEGIFNNTDAMHKAQLIDGYRKAALSVEVTFNTFKLYYFIEKFIWKWHRENWVEFSISVKRDLSKEDFIPDGKKVDASIEALYAQMQGKKTEPVTHTVAAGEYLVMIAEHYFNGDGDKWENIYLDNKNTIGTDPDVLTEGMKLVIRA
ncbi:MULTISPECIES: LysM peptidoglycan-binding domain-containing protein [unclassified Paenibacillus]|uniref:LysM peptidoglycan-binding domain-containing protein n=1 Tax=unclassified Paenibacillus TaxID=185978 RepID=UPI0036301A35